MQNELGHDKQQSISSSVLLKTAIQVISIRLIDTNLYLFQELYRNVCIYTTDDKVSIVEIHPMRADVQILQI